MDFFSNFFQTTPISKNVMTGSYSLPLVFLSYIVASLASYVALDITARIRKQSDSAKEKLWWLLGGAFAMGMGIWTMHFIGMLAFEMPMPMQYDPLLTVISMVFAITAAALAFFLITDEVVNRIRLILGGILMGLGIVSMHYTGMWAMMDVTIHYIPWLFFLSVAIAIVTSEVALWLMIKSSSIGKNYFKVISAFIMAFAICGMHYTGMAAAVITHSDIEKIESLQSSSFLSANLLSFFLATSTTFILAIALIANRFWLYALQNKNQKLIETEAILEQRNRELQEREEKIRAILTAAGDGIVVLDIKGNVEICNRAALEMLEYSPQKIKECNISNLIGTKQGEASPLKSITLSDLNNRVGKNNFYGIKENRSSFPIELTISQSINNNIPLYIIVFRDISERKQNEEKMRLLNHDLVITARKAGMAEVATSVLHNIGNVLNSINIATEILIDRNQNSQIHNFSLFTKKLEEEKNHLANFVTKDPVGKILPEYLTEYSNYLADEQQYFSKELESLKSKIQHVKNIIVMQQALSKGTNLVEKTNMIELIENALEINSMDKYGFIIERIYGDVPQIIIDKVKILQILVNLIKNAQEALQESTNKEKRLTIIVSVVDQKLVIEITDNGIGIAPENITNIFTYGFTTKNKGHGFGLHPSSLAAQEAGGSLKAFSLGKEMGSTFTLTLPYQISEKNSQTVSFIP